MKNKKAIFTTIAMFIGSILQAQPTVPPIMGWSSWNTYHVNINDSLIMSQADAMITTGLKDAGYRYVNIDDGFFGQRDKNGKMQPHPERFPRGLRPVVDHIHQLGMKAGIYSDAGANTCGSRYDNDENGFGAGLYGHERQDAQLYFKEWKFDFIKIDYCGAGQVLNLDERKRYTEIWEAFKMEGCSNVSINICRWAFPGTWAADMAASWRISPDIRPRWSSVKHIIDLNLYLSAYCRNGHYNDMDMLEISRGLKPNEEEVHFGMWCMMSSPLLIGCNLNTIKPASLSLLKNKELIALNQDPLALQAYVVQHENQGYVLVKDIEKLRGPVRAVAFYNPSDTLCRFSVPTSLLELKGQVKLRDLIGGKPMKPVHDSIIQTLPARSILIMRAEGQDRIEPTIYEAETAYLPQFDALGKRKKLISYASNEAASGKMVVRNLGGEPSNIMQWDNVWSDNGGKYELTISYIPAERRQLEVDINGHRIVIQDIASIGEIATTTISIMLKKGYNEIKLGNSYNWAPDIDKITLKRI